MTTLVITNVFPPKVGGSGRWFWEIYRRLPREEFVIAAGEHAGAAEFDGSHDLRVVRIPLSLSDWGTASIAGFRGYWQALRQLRQIVRRERIERVHCGACLPDGWLGYLLKRWYGLPYACYLHGEELNFAGSSRQLGWMSRRVLSAADQIIANSRNTERILREEWGLAHPNVRAAPRRRLSAFPSRSEGLGRPTSARLG